MRVDVKRKNFPVLPCRGSYLSCIQPPFRRSGLASYFLGVTRQVASYVSAVPCFQWWFDALGS